MRELIMIFPEAINAFKKDLLAVAFRKSTDDRLHDKTNPKKYSLRLGCHHLDQVTMGLRESVTASEATSGSKSCYHALANAA